MKKSSVLSQTQFSTESIHFLDKSDKLEFSKDIFLPGVFKLQLYNSPMS